MLTIDTARIFEPLLQPSRYKGAWGGRGSGKSHYLAGAVVEHCLLNPGSRIVCIREVQKTLAQSAKLLIENKIQEFGVGSQFRVLYDRIVTPGSNVRFAPRSGHSSALRACLLCAIADIQGISHLEAGEQF